MKHNTQINTILMGRLHERCEMGIPRRADPVRLQAAAEIERFAFERDYWRERYHRLELTMQTLLEAEDKCFELKR